MKPLFLITGISWRENSAGVCLLHTLGERLIDKGEMIRMSPCRLREGSRIQFIRNDSDLQGRKVILIEPEVRAGNQEWPDLTVRWYLNLPGKCAPDVSHTWGKNDLIASMATTFDVPGSIPLRFGMIDHSVFNNDNNPDDKNRTMNCFYGLKAHRYCRDLKVPEGVRDLSAGNLPQVELADIFRKTRKLYFAEVTACAPEAALCGAQTEFVTSSYEPVIPKGLEDPLAWHKEQEDNSDASLENFLDVCYKRVGLDRKVLVA